MLFWLTNQKYVKFEARQDFFYSGHLNNKIIIKEINKMRKNVLFELHTVVTLISLLRTFY